MKKRTIKILKIIAIILVALALIYAVAVGISASKLRRAYADLRKDGRPMNQVDVIPKIVSDTENAALLYESAGLLLKAQPAPEGNLLEYLGKLSDKFLKQSIEHDELTELQQLIDQDVVNQALSVVEQGTQRPSCRFDRDYSDGIHTLLPNLPNLRELSRILSAKARIEARAGNSEIAWKIIGTQLRLSNTLLNEPILVSQLVRIAIVRITCRTIHELCETAPPNEQQYHDILELFSNLDDIAPMVLATDGERLLLGEWAFKKLKDGSAGELSTDIGFDQDFGGVLLNLYSAFKPLSLADQAAYMRLMHKSIELIENPYSPENANVIEQQVQEHYYLLTRMLIPAMFRVKEIHCQMTAELRITRVGMALLQHKQKHGSLPETLEALELSDTNDPFSAESLRYRTQGQGFILYSIGPDQKDNDGSTKQKKQKDDWDIVWSYTGGN